MLKYFLILCCIICVQDEPVMSWSDSYKLTWPDFKATPNQSSSAVAITASGITFGFSVKETNTQVISFKADVQAHFYPEQSWYKPNLADNHVLGHEQFHFNITELYARKFRQQISQLKTSNNIKTELRQLYKTIKMELAVMQNKYDNESDYSRNVENQTKWKIFVTVELEKLSKYKSVD